MILKVACFHLPEARVRMSRLYTGRTLRRKGYVKGPIVDEVRRARENEAARHRFNIKAILSAAKKRQRRPGHKVLSLARKPRKLSA